MRSQKLMLFVITFLILPLLFISYHLSKEIWFSDDVEDDDYPIGVSSYSDETSIDLLSRADVCKVLDRGISFFIKNHRSTDNGLSISNNTRSDKETEIFNSTNITTGDEWSAYAIIKKQQCSDISDLKCYDHVRMLRAWKCVP